MVVFILVVFKVFKNHRKFRETNVIFDRFAAIQQKMVKLKISRIKLGPMVEKVVFSSGNV